MDQIAMLVATTIVNSHLATVLLLYLFVIYQMKSQLSRVFKLMFSISDWLIRPDLKHQFENLFESRRASRRNKSGHQSLGF